MRLFLNDFGSFLWWFNDIYLTYASFDRCWWRTHILSSDLITAGLDNTGSLDDRQTFRQTPQLLNDWLTSTKQDQMSIIFLLYSAFHQRCAVSRWAWCKASGSSARKTSVHVSLFNPATCSYALIVFGVGERNWTSYCSNKAVTLEGNLPVPAGCSVQQSSSRSRHRRSRRWILTWLRASARQNPHIHRTRRAPAQLSFSASSWGVGKVGWAAPETCCPFPWSERADEGSDIHGDRVNFKYVAN